MKTLRTTTKQITILIVALTIAFSANFAYGQWSNPTSAPPGQNVAAPITESAKYQIKTGDLGVRNMFVASTTYSNRYCDTDGNNCFTPSSITETSSSGQVTLGGAKLYLCPNIQNGSTGHTGCHTSCNGQVSSTDTCRNGNQSGGRCYYSNAICTPLYDFDAVTCEVRFTGSVRGSSWRTEDVVFTQTTVPGLAAIVLWQHHDDGAPYNPSRWLASGSWGGGMFDKSERASIGYLTDERYQEIGSSLEDSWQNQHNNIEIVTFPLVTGATASFVSKSVRNISAGTARLTAEVLSCESI